MCKCLTNNEKKSVESGLILLNKPSGITSFDALRDVKRFLGTGKVGHTGTLDKFASGLLIVLTGRALKLSRWFSGCSKKYTGKIHFGFETDTLDPEGEKISEAGLPSREQVENVLCQFRGCIDQMPPAYSAIHINGQRASSLTRRGETPEMKKRPVTIYKLDILSWEPPYMEIFVHCSSGTYIRSLARDIALASGSRAYLCELKRTQVGEFEINSDINQPETQKKREDDFKVIPIDKTVITNLGMPWFEVTREEAESIFHGKPPFSFMSQRLSVNDSSLSTTAVFFEDVLIAIIEKQGEKWKYACVLTTQDTRPVDIFPVL